MTTTIRARRVAAASLVLCLATTAALAVPEGPEYPSAEWTAREAANFARTTEAPLEQANPLFQARLQTRSVLNEADWLARLADDPSWGSPTSGNTNITPLCTSWMQQCAGDPFRYPDADPFYDSEAVVQPVVFYDRDCARISGRVWQPANAAGALPTVVIENGSIQAPEPLYWWMAQALVRAGYAVMTFDPRGQGRSDQQAPSGEQGSNANPTVFWDGLVDAIDFFRSTPQTPYPHNLACQDTYPTEVTPFNPQHAVQDRDRLGLAGHSLGGTGVSVVQSYGAAGAEPWPGQLDADNPVDVIVAWDSLRAPSEASGSTPAVVARVPAMGQSSEYGIFGTAFTAPPDPEGHKSAYAGWVGAGLPVYQLTIQGSTHFEWSLIPTFPATSWCPDPASGNCASGWGNPLAEHYSLAWFDRWLKTPGEPGFDTADARLLADADWVERYSFYFRSARNFATRGGSRAVCDDIRAGCADAGDSPLDSGSGADSGSGTRPLLLTAAGLVLALRRRRPVRPRNH